MVVPDLPNFAQYPVYPFGAAGAMPPVAARIVGLMFVETLCHLTNPFRCGIISLGEAGSLTVEGFPSSLPLALRRIFPAG